MRPEEMVKHLSVYQENSKGTYRGIVRSYYPKWRGWELLENNSNYEEVERAVEEFYISYYFYKLRLDLLENQTIAFAIFNFAVSNGKKKALQKLQKVTDGCTQGTDLIDTFNTCGKYGEYHLLLEFMEFYSFTGNPANIDWITRVYRCL